MKGFVFSVSTAGINVRKRKKKNQTTIPLQCKVPSAPSKRHIRPFAHAHAYVSFPANPYYPRPIDKQ